MTHPDTSRFEAWCKANCLHETQWRERPSYAREAWNASRADILALLGSEEIDSLLSQWKKEINARMEFKKVMREAHGGIYTKGAAKADEADRVLVARIDSALAAITQMIKGE